MGGLNWVVVEAAQKQSDHATFLSLGDGFVQTYETNKITIFDLFQNKQIRSNVNNKIQAFYYISTYSLLISLF